MTKLPRITARKLVAALERGGWRKARQEGSHLFLVHPGRVALVVVPMHAGQTLGPSILKRILAQAGLSAEELRGLL